MVVLGREMGLRHSSRPAGERRKDIILLVSVLNVWFGGDEDVLGTLEGGDEAADGECLRLWAAVGVACSVSWAFGDGVCSLVVFFASALLSTLLLRVAAVAFFCVFLGGMLI